MKTITDLYFDFPSEGDSMLLRDAAFAFITNGIDEALDFNPNAPALVSACLCNGTEYSFLDDDANYLMVADNGKGINFDEFFQNGDPGEIKRNHHYRKGVVRALSRLDPNGNGRIVVVTKGESGWTRYDGDFFGGEVIEETSDLGLSEKFNSYIFARIDESQNSLSDLDDFTEQLSIQYHFYLKDSEDNHLSLTWNGTKVNPLTFDEDLCAEYRSCREEFGSFTLEIDLFRTLLSKEEIKTINSGEDTEPLKQKDLDFIHEGGIAIYHNGLFIQDTKFQGLFKGKDAKEFYSKIDAIVQANQISEREAIMSEGVNIVNEIWSPDARRLPKDGIRLKYEFNNPDKLMDRYRYLVNVIPQDGFILDTDSINKSVFFWTDAFKQLLLAIDSIIGKEFREVIREVKIREIRNGFTLSNSLLGELIPSKQSGDGLIIRPMSSDPDAKQPLYARMLQDGKMIFELIADFKADEITVRDADELIAIHKRYVEEHEKELHAEKGVILAPDLSINLNGSEVSPKVISLLRAYKEEFTNPIQFRILINKQYYDEADDEIQCETIEV